MPARTSRFAFLIPAMVLIALTLLTASKSQARPADEESFFAVPIQELTKTAQHAPATSPAESSRSLALQPWVVLDKKLDGEAYVGFADRNQWGFQPVTAQAPIEQLRLFVRAKDAASAGVSGTLYVWTQDKTAMQRVPFTLEARKFSSSHDEFF